MKKIFVVTGEEEFLVERHCLNIISSHLINDIYHYSLPEDRSKFIEQVNSPNLDNSPRAFWVKSKDIPEDSISNNDILIVDAGVKKLAKKPKVNYCHFPKLKSYKNKNEVIDFIIQEGESRKISLKRIAPALFVNVGTSLRKLSSEIDKLAHIVPEGGSVDPDLIRSVTCFSSSLTPKEVVDAISEGKVQKALAFYQKLQEKDETGWILAYIMRHLVNQIRIDHLYAIGTPIGDIPSEIGMNEFVFSKTYGMCIKRWSFDTLRKCLSDLCRLDVLHKRGTDVRCALERTIIELSLEAGDVSK